MSDVNRQILLASRPVGMIEESNFERAETPRPQLADGEALVRTVYLSLDPTIRGWMNEGEGYMPPIAIGEQVRAGGVCQVVESRSDAYAEGDLLFGMPGWQEWSIVDAGARAMQKLPPLIERTRTQASSRAVP